MSVCGFHGTTKCVCWRSSPQATEAQATQVQPSMCDCPEICHSPGCRYYGPQLGARTREKMAAEQFVKDLGGASLDQALRGTAGLEWGKSMDAESPLGALRRRRGTYIQYMRDRIEDEDWHGVSDAANDLRELDCEIRCAEAKS